ncbi:MAG: hypothetical protein HQK89_01195 [Nitrospirae bacterium]|nr:hypothetical protein [Nitrospirota bacterium]
MVSNVSNLAQPQPAAKSKPQPTTDAAAQTKPPPAPGTTVKISKAASTALQESRETPAQTAKEARSGDMQATRLLAKEAAAKAATNG